jgi:hypothetical protein
MKILFHTNTLNYRGTTVAISDYARFNEEILGHDSVIAYNASLGYEKDMGSEQPVIDTLKKEFNVVGYKEGDLEAIIDKEKIDLAYFIRAGNKEPLPTNTKTAVHAVFQYNEPHGDKYAYISEWLSNSMSNGKIPFVPHLIHLPEQTKDFREHLKIGKDKIVIGAMGGYYSFDLSFVKYQVKKLAHTNDNFVFLFLGIEPFMESKNAIFLNQTNDLQKKSNFINTCDAMLHARQRGESFGLSIAEFLYFDKPVLAWENGLDKNHLELLKGSNTLYNAENFTEKLTNIKDLDNQTWYTRVMNLGPIPVMSKFKKTFIEG